MTMTQGIIYGILTMIVFLVLGIFLFIKYVDETPNFLNRKVFVLITPALMAICWVIALSGSIQAFTAYECPQCNTYYNSITLDPKQNSYCIKCGYRFSDAKPKVKKEFCKECGDEFSVNEQYCSICGTPRGEASP